MENSKIIHANDLAIAIYDGFPVSPGPVWTEGPGTSKG